MNKIILMGNLTRDPELSYAQSSNMAIGRFGIAVSRHYQRDNEDNVDFFNCTAFGKTAEFVEKYFHKGSRMLLTGRVQNDNYTNKNGERVYSVQIIVEDVEFASSKAEDAQSGSYGGAQGSSDSPMPTPPNPDDADGADDFVKVDKAATGDIPFFNQ